jgi:hypothetical protein
VNFAGGATVAVGAGTGGDAGLVARLFAAADKTDVLLLLP